MEKNTKEKTKCQTAAEKKYPGAAEDNADKGKVTEQEVKQRTETLDFNPHSEGI